MDLKRIHTSDQLPYYSTSPRKKVVSGFGLGVIFSLLLIIIGSYHVSFKASFFDSVWEGLYLNGGNGTTPPFWSFSFSATSCFYSCRKVTTTPPPSVNDTIVEELKQSVPGNDTENYQNGKKPSMDSGGKGIVMNNKEDEGKNSSRKGDEGNIDLIPGHVNSSTEFVNSGVDKIGDASNVTVSNSPKTENVSVDAANKNVTCGENVGKSNSFYGDCDIFDGKWVRDDSKPYYPPGSCPYIDIDFDCHRNKRPDSDYVNWRWQPHGCDIPKLNATHFLERLRGQKLVLVGDSLNRNMWESLVCILRHSVPDKSRVYETSGRTEFKKGGAYAFRFEDYNCSVDFINSPFLVRESSFNGVNGSFETLRLDMMDSTASMYEDADILVFNTAHWWTHEKTSRGEDYYQEGNHVHGRLKVLEAYKRAITTWGRWVDKHVNKGKTRVIFRGYSGVHFSGGQWNSGGQCHKETEPIFDETQLDKYPRKMKALEYVLKGMKTPVTYMNISRLTEFRKDAHPSIYRKEYKSVEEQIAAEQSQDCSHWCLPGVPDTWNELLYASLLKADAKG